MSLPPDTVELSEDELPVTGPAIQVTGLVSQFGDKVIHQGLDLTVRRGQVRLAR